MLEKKNEALSEDEGEYLKPNEEIKGEVQVKKPRSEAQIKAFEKTREKRRLKLEERAKAKQTATKPKPVKEESESEEEQVVTRKVIKKKKKKKPKIIEEIIYQDATSSEEEEDMDYSSHPKYSKPIKTPPQRKTSNFIWA
jgi:hypothetical protein